MPGLTCFWVGRGGDNIHRDTDKHLYADAANDANHINPFERRAA
jgi:hypothetical protein